MRPVLTPSCCEPVSGSAGLSLLQFQHADYQPLDLNDFIGDKLYVAKMMPTTLTPVRQSVPKSSYPTFR